MKLKINNWSWGYNYFVRNIYLGNIFFKKINLFLFFVVMLTNKNYLINLNIQNWMKLYDFQNLKNLHSLKNEAILKKLA